LILPRDFGPVGATAAFAGGCCCGCRARRPCARPIAADRELGQEQLGLDRERCGGGLRLEQDLALFDLLTVAEAHLLGARGALFDRRV
jgi:hypothetical protein